MTAINASGVSKDDLAMLFGETFRHIEVLSVEFVEGMQVTKILLDGRVLNLVGDPENAMQTLLGGTMGERFQA